jgi:hypothetical protein
LSKGAQAVLFGPPGLPEHCQVLLGQVLGQAQGSILQQIAAANKWHRQHSNEPLHLHWKRTLSC